LSRRVTGLPADDASRLVRLLEASHLPVAPPPIPAARWLELMARDKKSEGGAMRFVLLDALGRATVRSGVDEAALHEALRA
jgi:3-dehydroquinate synthetase